MKDVPSCLMKCGKGPETDYIHLCKTKAKLKAW